MPRWRALPDELDPQIKEFATQLRRLIDRGGLSIAALADRTGYSRTSWDRYLNGRLLAPKGAVIALAEVTGTNPVHLITLWELAERAWSRSEMRQDMTMEAIRIAQARAEFAEPETAEPQPETAGAKSGRNRGREAGRNGSGGVIGGTTARPGIAGPAGVSPTVPPQQQHAGTTEEREAGDAARTANSWRLAGYQGPAPTGTGTGTVAGAGTGPGPSAASTPPAPDSASASPQDPRPPKTPRRRRLTMFLSGLLGALLVLVAVFYFSSGGDSGDGGKKEAGSTPGSAAASASTGANANLPAGVKCTGASCAGKDPEAMGCGGASATTTTSVTVATTLVEVRYSKVCAAAWARIVQATQGDTVTVTAGKKKETGSVEAAGDTDAYTPMVALKSAADATACVTLAAGQKGCTTNQ
ncbi:Protein of unknown function DUF2690 [Actinobacteria bacterium OK074]|nr:Protein of unknown function DUF2690 [Actinobacteria bacterium OK074]